MITQMYNELVDKDRPALIAQELIAFFQDDFFFRLAFEKEKRVNYLISQVKGKPMPRLLLSNYYNFHPLSVESFSAEIDVLDKEFFIVHDEADEERKAAYLFGAIVIVCNSDAGPRSDGYIKLYNRCTNTIFVMWDQDNHHWLSASTLLAAHSDLYVPTHRENHYALSRYNSAITELVPALSFQWTRKFLKQNTEKILSYPRSDEPLGMHSMYSRFVYRNRVITTLNHKFSSVGYTAPPFHSRTDEDRLREWCGHKSHWIVPVLNDIPTRLFDALITGGIPIVPESLRFLTPISDIGREHILFYGPLDIVDPEAIVAKASAMFDQGGKEKILERHCYALDHLHGDVAIERILSYVVEKFEISKKTVF